MIVRAANTVDIPRLCRLMQFVQDVHAEAHPEVFQPTLDPEPTAGFFANLLAGDWDLVLVAEIDGRVVGYIWCEEFEQAANFYRKPTHFGYVHHIAVVPEHRRNRIGSQLVAQALAQLAERGATRISVEFWDFNAPARALFAGLGFSVQREFASRTIA